MNSNENVKIYKIIVRNSDAYPASHFRSGLFLTGLVSTLLYFLPFTMGDPILFLYFQAGAFLLGYLLAFGKKWKRFFITKKGNEGGGLSKGSRMLL